MGCESLSMSSILSCKIVPADQPTSVKSSGYEKIKVVLTKILNIGR